ncbi:MATH and LRR domain-containing protein PFE0570w, partial [Aphis craccivora]
INYLSRLERPKVADMIRQIMAKVFYNNILSMYSYVGQKNKNVFSVLNSCSLNIGSIAKHRSCTDLEIFGPLKMSMANAKFHEVKRQQKYESIKLVNINMCQGRHE